MIELGSKARDKITGFRGTITGYVQYLTGCHQYLLVPDVKADGTLGDAHWFDEQRVDPVAAPTQQLDNRKTPGADQPAPIR